MHQRAGRGRQASRVVLAAIFVAFGVVMALNGSWFGAAIMLLGTCAAVAAFRRGEAP